MKKTRLLISFGIILLLVVIIAFPGRKLAREHVNNKTAITDHPLMCSSCHLYTTQNHYISKFVNEDYLSPFNLDITNNGENIFVVAQDANALLVVDTKSKKVLNKINVGIHPHSIIIDEEEKFCYVSNQWSDNVSVVHLKTAAVVDTIKTGNGPSGLSISASGKYLYAVNTFGSDVSVIDLTTKKEIKRISTGSDPTGIALSPKGKNLYVTSRRAKLAPYGDPLVSELTLINDNNQRLTKQINVPSAYLMENIAFTPSSDLAIMTLIRPKNLVPSVQVEGGWMMTHGIGIIEQKEDGKIIQLLLDEPNSYYSDPYDIAITPDGKKAFVSSSGRDYISVISMDSIKNILASTSANKLKLYANNLGISKRFIIKRIKTGANPKGLKLSKDGNKLYIAEHLEDKIGVINTKTLEKEKSIDLGGPTRITVARQGRRLFNNAGHTFQHQYACYTCHPDNHEDGLVYNMAGKYMGRNVTNTQSLREISGTAPFKWNGKNQTVYKQDGIRFSTVLTRTEQFSFDDLDAITAYIKTGIKYPPNLLNNPSGELTESQFKGKELFNRAIDNSGKKIPENGRCVTCHPAPFYTNLQLADVGTLAESDDPILFDTPHLNNIYSSAPYLHDGRAKTLEEIWTIYGEEDKHGYVNDMTKIQLNDLVEYLKSLRGPTYEKSKPESYANIHLNNK